MNIIDRYIDVVERGYEVKNGKVYFKGKEKKLRINNGYATFSVRMPNTSQVRMKVHKLVAFQKFGQLAFIENVVVRHKDGNSLNNTEDNIILGTHSDNMQDISPEVRLSKAIYASSFVTLYNHEDIIKARSLGMTYSEIMHKFSIKSKGTISFILNKSLKSKNVVIAQG